MGSIKAQIYELYFAFNLLHKRPAVDIFLDQFPCGSELHFHFDLLETAVCSYQTLADEIRVSFIGKAEIVIQVHTAFDDLATALAFDLEDIKPFFRFGRCSTKEVFEEAHGYL